MVFKTFFGRNPVNWYDVDSNLKRVLEYYLGASMLARYEPFLRRIGEIVGFELEEVVEYTDKIGRPKLVKWSVFGEEVDEIWLNPAHRELLYKLYREGVVSLVFRENAPWHIHYAAGYLIYDPGLYCSITVTLATAYTLYKYGGQELKNRYLKYFMHGEDTEIWQGATWVTEVQGGSDVGANKTIAKYVDGKWRLFGEKYFTSNVGAELALVTARPEGGKPGAKGIALFLVPRFREDGKPNYVVKRLKEKLGTIAVPTGEVVFDGSEAYLIGELDKGIYYTMEMLTVSRIANIIGSAGLARKALYESINYVYGREAFGKKLKDHPLMRFDILDMLVETEAAISLAFKTVDLFNKAWNSKPPYDANYHYMRFITHVAKNRTADQAAYVALKGLEVHGGIGFLEDFPYSRLLRDALVTPIWEGTSNIQALDLLETIVKKKAHEKFFEEVENGLENLSYGKSLAKIIGVGLSNIYKALDTFMEMGLEYASYHAKNLLNLIADVYQGLILTMEGEWEAEKFGDGRKLLVAKMFVDKHLGGGIDRGILKKETLMIDLFEDIINYREIELSKVEKILR